MKTLKSSLLRKLIIGYKASTNQKLGFMRGENWKVKPSRQMSMPDTKQLAEAINIPSPSIERIYNETKKIETDMVSNPDIQFLKNKVEDLERRATDSGAYILPQVASSIIQTKEKLREIEVGASDDVNPAVEIKHEIEELEREKSVLEEAKNTVMQKFYNREIDESSLKSITDNYEQRLVEINIKIENWRKELEKADSALSMHKTSQERKDLMLSLLRTNKLTVPQFQLQMNAPPIVINLPKILRPAMTPSRYENQEQETTPPQKIELYAASDASNPLRTSKIIEGFEIPQMPKKGAKIEALETEEEKSYLSLAYPLIPRSPAKNEHVFAYTQIFWDNTNNRYVYNLVEPELNEKLKDVYKRVKEMLEQRLDIDFSKLKKIEARDFLDKQVDDVLEYFNFVITENEKRILKYYTTRDFTGLEMIEPIIQDSNIEDISCDGVGIPIFIFHRNPEIGSVATNISFDDPEQLDSFVIRLAQLCGKAVSVSEPLLDGTLPDGSRVQATLGTDIARRGSNFTIRKFTEEPLTPIHLLNYGTLDTSILGFLWFVVDYGRSVLVSGGTASGKTSLLNVISLFIRPEKKIVSIEDTAELQLPHPHWVPVVARTAIAVEGKGEVDMFELLRESLRQRPDYIVVGEVRGKEAYILFQQMATGHPSLATIHAENTQRLIDRLTTPPISLPAGLINSLDIVVFLARMKYKDKFTRKVTEIVELGGFDQETGKPIINQIFKWNPQNDRFEIANKSISLKKVSEFTGISEKDIRNEIGRRIVVLEWMKENNILNYKDVHKIFSLYYSDPERLFSAIQGAG